MLTDFGSVRLANLTINTRSDSLQLADEAAQYCTMSYRAPELFDPPRSSSLDSRTDVWGIGCLLFSWWFGYSPVLTILMTMIIITTIITNIFNIIFDIITTISLNASLMTIIK